MVKKRAAKSRRICMLLAERVKILQDSIVGNRHP